MIRYRSLERPNLPLHWVWCMCVLTCYTAIPLRRCGPGTMSRAIAGQSHNYLPKHRAPATSTVQCRYTVENTTETLLIRHMSQKATADSHWNARGRLPQRCSYDTNTAHSHLAPVVLPIKGDFKITCTHGMLPGCILTRVLSCGCHPAEPLHLCDAIRRAEGLRVPQ